jgi:hypothetical protein
LSECLNRPDDLQWFLVCGTSYLVLVGFVERVVTASVTSWVPLLSPRACP